MDACRLLRSLNLWVRCLACNGPPRRRGSDHPPCTTRLARVLLQGVERQRRRPRAAVVR